MKSEFIFETAPFASCHASTIVEIGKGELMAAWFGGTHESAPDVCIWASRTSAGKWSNPVKIADGKGYACYNPVLFQPSKGPLLLFYKVGRGPQTWWGMMTRSSDEGLTWSTPERLPKGVFGPIKSKPVELRDGTILCGSSDEGAGWRVHFEATRDYGKTWKVTPPLNDGIQLKAIQPSILTLSAKHVRAIGRTQNNKLFSIDSLDQGRTWGPMRLSDVPNPNSGTDALTLKDGRHLLVYNPSTTHGTPLAVAISTDAEHWSKMLTLEDQPGEYSYPAVVQGFDGLVQITYTWQRTRIKHVVIDPTKF
ncbi:MAG: sialidase family protein [bacterium]